MKEAADLVIPAHLEDLLQPTPSGTAKLIAAWDGLSPESQILILKTKKKAPGPGYLHDRLIEKALSSENAYVRYLAIQGEYISDDDDDKKGKLLKKRIEDDPDPLVRYALLESDWFLRDEEFDDPKKFFALPHEARLAKIRKLTGNGEQLSKLISHAVEHELPDGAVSELELWELLEDYLNKPTFKQNYEEGRRGYDGFGTYMDGENIESLWKLVPIVPEAVSYCLIEHLPESAGLSSGIPQDVLNGLSAHQLGSLLERQDIGLVKFRKKIFRFKGDAGTDEEQTDQEETEETYLNDRVRSAAITYQFDLSNKEFAQVLAKPDIERVRDLKDLSLMAQDLRLCLYDAIHDALFASKVSPLGADYEDAWYAKQTFERKIKELQGWQREKQLRELKLYRLAVEAVPWETDKEGYPPYDDLEFLRELIVEGDTWATFMAFSDEWGKNRYHAKRLEKHLPTIWEAGEEEESFFEEINDGDEVDNSEVLAVRVADRLTNILAAASIGPDDGNSKLANAIGKLSAQSTSRQELISEKVSVIENEIVRLIKSNSKLRLYIITVIIFIVVSFFIR